MMVLQTIALPLGYAALFRIVGAGRTRKKHMEMSWQVKEKDDGGLFDAGPPEEEKGFQVRDLIRFFAVDIILVATLRICNGLGMFSSANQYVLAIVVTKVILFAYLMWLINDRRQAWAETGGSTAGRWWAWLVMIGLYAGYFVLIPSIDSYNHLLMDWLYGILERPYTPRAQDVVILIFEDVVDLPVRLCLVFLTALAGPFMEELAFRGVGLDGFRRTFGVVLAVFWTSLLFGLYHFSLPLLLPLSLLGMLFAVVRLLSGSLWCAVAMHCLHNSLALGIVAHRLGLLREWVPS